MRSKPLAALCAALLFGLVGATALAAAPTKKPKPSPAAATGGKVNMCHAGSQISVSRNALRAHVQQGDFPAPTGGCAAALKATHALIRQNLANGAMFSGIFVPKSFEVQDGKLVAVGTLTGALVNGKSSALVNRSMTLPVVGGAAATACKILHLNLGPLDLNLLGLVVHTNRIVLDITAQPGPGNLLGNLLCSVANALNGNPTQIAVGLLDQLVGSLDQVDVTGTAANGTQFAGTFTPKGVTLDNGKPAVTGVLAGTLTDGQGNEQQVTGQNVTLPLDSSSATATCSILHLVLGPLDLDLLGLQVHLNKVVLDVTAVPGPGNLLGNLLCSVAHLLDPQSPLQGIADLLNGLLRPGQA